MNEIKVLDKGWVRLHNWMGDDMTIVESARQSTNKGLKNPKEDEEFLRWILRHGHTSPFEMCVFRFEMKLPIFVARQIVRHRTASINELSGRYTTSLSEFYVPDEEVFTKTNPTTTAEKVTLESAPNREDYVEYELCPKDFIDEWKWQDVFKTQNDIANNEYERLVKTGVRKELARCVLPLSTYTQWFWKMDLHNLFHFLELRLGDHAQWETREYARAILELIRPIVPLSVKAFEDYVLNSMKFSKAELNIIRELIYSDRFTFDPSYKKYNISDKEKKEFLNKLEKIDKD